MTYEKLLVKADSEGLNVKEKHMKGNDGQIRGLRIAIRKNIETTIEKSCVLAEELGHYYTSYGNIIDQSLPENRKQEYRARLRGYDIKLGLNGIIRAYEHGCHASYDMAEYLEVTEEYLLDALRCYKGKYGPCVCFDNYVITFIPNLSVCKMIGA